MKKRILSMVLAIAMVAGMLPTAVFAAEGDNLCDHHTEHTADCGYAPAVEGSPCTHECGEECAEACTHAHDALCGYVEAAAEVPCGYVCEESHVEATRVIYVDESTFLASGYSHFYDANENLLTATREEQEDGWVKYTMPADAKYYLTYDGHIGGGGGGNYPELPTNADTYDPFSDTWSCSHPGYAEGNCRLCGEPCPGHTYNNACDAECNVCYEIREVGDHVYDGAEDAECNECSYVRDITPVQITGVSITVDGVLYTEGNVTITPDSTVILTVTGTNLHNGSDDHRVDYASGLYQPVNPDYFEISEDGTTATYAPSAGDFANSSNFEITYCNNDTDTANRTVVPTGIYLTYDDGIAEEDKARITGMSITIDGVVYDSSNTSAEDPAVITPNTGFITITVHGTALQNCTVDHMVSYYSGSSEPILPDYLWRFEADGTSAFHHYSSASALSDFARNTTPFELQYSNNGSFSAANPAIGSGVYIVYDDSTGGEEDTTPAEITGVSITVDGETYTSGNVTITPTSTITLTVTGTNLQNGTEDNRVDYANGAGDPVGPDYFEISEDGSTATSTPPAVRFANSSNFEITYYNNYTDTDNRTAVPTGIYLTYDDSAGGEEDTTPAEITGVSVTVDGVEYTSGNVTITPTSTVIFTVTGTNLQNGTGDNYVVYAFGCGDPVTDDWFTFSDDGTTATMEIRASNFSGSQNFEIVYYNNYTDSNNRIPVSTGIYLTYDDSTGGEEDTTSAEITGVTVTVDGVPYTSGNVTITPTSTIIYTVTGTNFANLSADNIVSYASGSLDTLHNGGWTIDTETNTATRDFSDSISWFDACDNFEVRYSNDGDVGSAYVGTGIYLTYDDGTGGGEDTTPAEITGVSITVDGVTYTEGDVTITPETQSIIITVTGTNFANASEDNILELGPGLTTFLTGFIWKIDLAANTATADFSGRNSEFEDHNGTEIMYSNDSNQNWTGTGIYLTYDDGSGGEEDTTPDSTGKILVEMTDNYGDGWNGAAIEIFKNGSLENTVTVDKDFNTLSLDYDSTATYEFKWVKGGYDYECSFTIYVDGEKELSVDDASSYAVGQTILTLEATTKELAITQQPTDSEAKLGENYCVEVIAQGEELKYQWYFKNAGSEQWHKSGVTDNTYDDVMTTARAGREVYCVITDADGNSVTTETAKLIAVKTAELAIIQQPNDSSAKLDEMFCVEVLAEGDGLKYQWYWRQIGDENWTVSGQRDNTYDDVMTSARHNREVYCVITDAWGDSVTTEIATITGTPTTTLAITRQPESQSVTIGDMFNVTFEAQGDGLKYQWYFRQAGTEVWYTSAQKDNSYDDVMTKARHNRELYCVVTDAWGNIVETDPIVVILATPRYELAITAQPENESVKMGEMFCVTVEAQGDELKYQWYWRNVGSENWNVSGQRDNTYDDVMTKARHNREVKCVITDMWGESVETEIATITAIPDQVLAIVAQPTDATAAMGENYCVTVEAQGDGLTYQWYFKNAGTDVWHVSGVKDNTYDDVMIESRAGRQVYCVITDIWGNTFTSETVTLVCTDIPQAITKN